MDSFLAASAQEPFKHRVIVTTTNDWGEHAEAILLNQSVPVHKLTLSDLERSQVDWVKFRAKGG